MRTPREESASGIYHVIAKGVGGQLIVEDDEDRVCFVSLLKRCVSKTCVTLLAWCLMDNHYHLLIEAQKDALSSCMARLQSSYALLFNKRHGREGYLFQGRFKSMPVERDEYLLVAVRYIHQNPVKAKITPTCDYPWSSYKEYVDSPELIDAEMVMDLFGGVDQFCEFHKTFDDSPELAKGFEWERRLTDEDALAYAIQSFGDAGLGRIKCLPKEERNASIRQLKDHGCTVRQIRRLTGISLGVISAV